MNRESFLDAVRKYYTGEVQEAYLASLHGGEVRLDMPELRRRIRRLMQCAAIEGLRHDEFDDIVRSMLPEAVSRPARTRKAA